MKIAQREVSGRRALSFKFYLLHFPWIEFSGFFALLDRPSGDLAESLALAGSSAKAESSTVQLNLWH